MRLFLTILSFLLLAGCGGLVVFERDDGEGGAGGSSTTSTTSTTTATSSKSSTASTGSSAQIDPEIIDVNLGANCMPKIGPDPILGSIVVRYTNQGNAAGSLVIADAQILIANPMEGWAFPLELSPTSSGTIAAGAVVDVEHAKVTTPGDASFICSLCGLDASVTVRWLKDGGEVSDVFAVPLGCAF
ncbi:MAG: hypothetical protein JNL21_24975 [Myxococcales bacterium]|nr:hypothetical protein [Myxococcales bacterium]